MLRLFEKSEVAENYARYSPFYPDGVAETIANHAKKRQGESERLNLMLDVGCGTGQSTKYFHSYVEKIIGIDPSMKQIEQAQKVNYADNVTYMKGEAENLPFEKNSIDILTSAMGAHYFDFEPFFKECGRVLKPNGTLALYGYCRPVIVQDNTKYHVEANECLARLREKCLWHERSHHTRNQYCEIFEMIPSREKFRVDSLKMEKEYSLHDYIKYASTWTGYRAYKNEAKTPHELDILDEFVRDLRSALNIGNEVDNRNVPIHMEWDVFILLSEPPITQGRVQGI